MQQRFRSAHPPTTPSPTPGVGLDDRPVVLVASRQARAGREHELSDSLARIAAGAVRSGGASQVDVVRSEDGTERFSVMLHFDRQLAARHWEASATRAHLLTPVEESSEGAGQLQLLPRVARVEPPSPSRFKRAVVAYLAIAPLAYISQLLVGPALLGLEPLVRALALSALLVPAMTYIAVPLWTRLLRRWLSSGPVRPASERKPRRSPRRRSLGPGPDARPRPSNEEMTS